MPSLEEVLRSDVVTLHVPLTNETRNIIGANEIASMPRGTILINAARGEVLDLDAALSALANDHLGGLAIDVFDPSRPSRAFPDDPRLIVTPHIAGCTFEAKNDAAEAALRRAHAPAVAPHLAHQVHAEVIDEVQVDGASSSTKSARLPASIEPISFAIRSEYAPLSVAAVSDSSTVIFICSVASCITSASTRSSTSRGCSRSRARRSRRRRSAVAPGA
jgi:hypothetical protein